MKPKQLFSSVILAGVWIAFGVAPIWTQTTPAPGKDQTKMKEGKGERTGEEKMEARGAQEPGRMERKKGEEEMEARGAQEPGRMERKKGEEEMEARGAQKPGRMEKSGAEAMGAKESQGERWATQDVKKAQEALKNKGHDPGSMDGVIGPQTRQAIKAFQSANGLKGTGRLDAETAEKLGVEKGTASGTSSRGSAAMGKGQAAPMPKEPPSPMSK